MSMLPRASAWLRTASASLGFLTASNAFQARQECGRSGEEAEGVADERDSVLLTPNSAWRRFGKPFVARKIASLEINAA